VDEFGRLLNDAARKAGSKQALAAAIGISPQRLSRVLDGQYSLSVVNCLRFARFAGIHPSIVLRASGKSELADLIEETYGSTEASKKIPETERQLLRDWQALPPSSREHLRYFLSRELEHAGRVETQVQETQRATGTSDAAAGKTFRKR
jgi:plasmid maintenance system antidote protein VapI